MKQKKILKLCGGVPCVTRDMLNGLVGRQEDHRRRLIRLINEYAKR